MDKRVLVMLLVLGVFVIAIVLTYNLSSESQFATVEYQPNVMSVVVDRTPAGCLVVFIPSVGERITKTYNPCIFGVQSSRAVTLHMGGEETTIGLIKLPGYNSGEDSCYFGGARVALSGFGDRTWLFEKPRDPKPFNKDRQLNWSNCTFEPNHQELHRASGTWNGRLYLGSSKRSSRAVTYDYDTASYDDKVVGFDGSCRTYNYNGGGTNLLSWSISKTCVIDNTRLSEISPAGCDRLEVTYKCKCKYGYSCNSRDFCICDSTITYTSGLAWTGDRRYGFKEDKLIGSSSLGYCNKAYVIADPVFQGCAPSCYPEVGGTTITSASMTGPYVVRTNDNMVRIFFDALNIAIIETDWQRCAIQYPTWGAVIEVDVSKLPTTTTTTTTTSTTSTTPTTIPTTVRTTTFITLPTTIRTTTFITLPATTTTIPTTTTTTTTTTTLPYPEPFPIIPVAFFTSAAFLAVALLVGKKL